MLQPAACPCSAAFRLGLLFLSPINAFKMNGQVSLGAESRFLTSEQ